jgi:tRNA(fMet)-specific endonuclease VapC
MLIHHARARDKRKSARSLLAYYPNLSVISVYEIEFGAFRAGRVSDIQTLQVSLNILPLTEPIVRRAAALEASLVRQNWQLGIKDTFIAATCLIHNLPLLTVNIRHFDRVEGLQLIELNALPFIDE